MDALERREELRAALGLAGAGGVGAVRFRELVDGHGSARAALHHLTRRGGPSGAPSGADGASAGAGAGDPAPRRLRPAPAERLQRLEANGRRVVSYGLSGYPAGLGHLHRPPPVLWLEGPRELPDGRAVAVVGTRKSTGYGRRMARDLAGGLAAAGWTVVSGMAAGIDGAAHRAALDAGGPTVGVLGSGLDHRYPRVNRDLYGRMRREGLLASEFEPGLPPAPGLFPRRNRIIAALAEAVVVVQAGRRSGTSITVGHALELGREVLAVPGPVGPEASRGVHEMLREGATPATCAADVVAALGGPSTDEVPGDGDGGQDGPAAPGRDLLAALFGRDAGEAVAICRGLASGPRHADDLAAESGLDPGTAAALLCRLELEGLVRGLPGGRFALEGDGGAGSGGGEDAAARGT